MHVTNAAEAMKDPYFSNLVGEIKEDGQKLADAEKKEGTPDTDGSSDNN